MSELLEMGVDGLISDYPTRALEVVRRRASARR
jgi:glycerophosphoryl diester phosphodiesterase